MKRFLLYGHGGSYNHGAEAIVKCTARLLREYYPGCEVILSTHFKKQDEEFGLPVDAYCERFADAFKQNAGPRNKADHDKKVYQRTIDQIKKGMVCMSVGGDNYCYDNWRKWKVIHETALDRDAISVLWSCSIEPSMINGDMLATLKSHHLISAREAITYEALRDKGLTNVVPCADIAFLLEAQKCALPAGFSVGNTVAVNLSPLVIRRETSKGILLQNITNLIDFIIAETDMHVALIPHVLMPTDNDYELLDGIHRAIENKKRICLVPADYTAAQYKYIISQCRFGVFARTHASIAAYSSNVPTLVIVYSVKSKGIASDLGLGDYVLPLTDFTDERILLSRFKKLMIHEEPIRRMLSEKIPSYKEKARILPVQSGNPVAVHI
jgi:polysaccharide pyruvyl transferase WcaK-like protein